MLHEHVMICYLVLSGEQVYSIIQWHNHAHFCSTSAMSRVITPLCPELAWQQACFKAKTTINLMMIKHL